MMPVDDGNRVSSPCVSICELDEDTGMCRGCWRTLDDIRIWMQASDDVRREIVARAEASRVFRMNRMKRTNR